MINITQAKDYLRVDYEDEDVYITNIIELSQIYIDSMVGEGYKQDKDLVKLAELLQYKLISDMFETRSTEVPQSTKIDRITNSILDKLGNYQEGDIDDKCSI